MHIIIRFLASFITACFLFWVSWEMGKAKANIAYILAEGKQTSAEVIEIDTMKKKENKTWTIYLHAKLKFEHEDGQEIRVSSTYGYELDKQTPPAIGQILPIRYDSKVLSSAFKSANFVIEGEHNYLSTRNNFSSFVEKLANWAGIILIFLALYIAFKELIRKKNRP